MKLGKLPPKHDPRTLRLADYLTGSLPPAPASVDWGVLVKRWPMDLNDVLGDCTIAAAAHQIQAWNKSARGTNAVVTDPTVLKAYRAVSGYDPADPNTDQGAYELDVLNYWRKHGVGSHKIKAFAALEPGNAGHVRDSVNLFGGAYIGIALPLTAESQVGKVWSVVANAPPDERAAGSWGGHAVNVTAYDGQGLTVVTWGALQRMTWGFWAAYVDEAYALLAVDWFSRANLSPGGLDLTALLADLQLVTGGR